MPASSDPKNPTDRPPKVHTAHLEESELAVQDPEHEERARGARERLPAAAVELHGRGEDEGRRDVLEEVRLAARGAEELVRLLRLRAAAVLGRAVAEVVLVRQAVPHHA
ncbi:hypothetical protein DL769_001409 [Monosporascus sp. CRB-8-3]|nr:hypothetical protein DL769_001409 [Monosporascus sp. CRB-8-3]